MTSKARQLADLGGDTDNLEDVSSAYGSGALSNRNLIINGAMQVAQRGTSFTPTSDNTYTLDRWRSRYFGSGSGRFSVSQETSSTPDDFPYAIKATVTTTDTSGTYGYSISYTTEGNTLNGTAFGTSSAKDITLSFWVRSSVTGTYCVSHRNGAATKSFVSEYSINTADTWEYKTITVSGETSGTWSTDNTAGLLIDFGLGGQTSKTTTANAWQTGNYVYSSNQTDWINTSGATFYLTGVQLEVGDTATPFEHRSYGQELALCQRYYETSNTNGQRLPYTTVAFYNTGSAFGYFQWQVEKRAIPTVTYNGANWNLYKASSGLTETGVASDGISTKAVCFVLNGSGFPSGEAGFADNRTDDAIVADAEL